MEKRRSHENRAAGYLYAVVSVENIAITKIGQSAGPGAIPCSITSDYLASRVTLLAGENLGGFA